MPAEPDGARGACSATRARPGGRGSRWPAGARPPGARPAGATRPGARGAARGTRGPPSEARRAAVRPLRPRQSQHLRLQGHGGVPPADRRRRRSRGAGGRGHDRPGGGPRGAPPPRPRPGAPLRRARHPHAAGHRLRRPWRPREHHAGPGPRPADGAPPAGLADRPADGGPQHRGGGRGRGARPQGGNRRRRRDAGEAARGRVVPGGGSQGRGSGARDAGRGAGRRRGRAVLLAERRPGARSRDSGAGPLSG